MGENANTFRLASGVFYDHRKLESALSELHAEGFGRGDLCLAGRRKALEELVQQRTSLIASLTGKSLTGRQLRPLYPLPGNIEVVATSGNLLRKLMREATWRSGEQQLLCAWLVPELLGGFAEHMRQSAIALLVSAPDAILQNRSSRILLRHSAHTVQTHEFTPTVLQRRKASPSGV
jgi:hypothetical protein